MAQFGFMSKCFKPGGLVFFILTLTTLATIAKPQSQVPSPPPKDANVNPSPPAVPAVKEPQADCEEWAKEKVDGKLTSILDNLLDDADMRKVLNNEKDMNTFERVEHRLAAIDAITRPRSNP